MDVCDLDWLQFVFIVYYTLKVIYMHRSGTAILCC